MLIFKGFALMLALLAVYAAGESSGEKKSELTEEQKIEIQEKRNNVELYGTEDGVTRGLRNRDKDGNYYYLLYVKTDDERTWDVTDVDGGGEDTCITGYHLCRWYPGNDTLCMRFEGKAYDDVEGDTEEVHATDKDGNMTRVAYVFTTEEEFAEVLENMGEKDVNAKLIELGVKDQSYRFVPQ